MHRRLRYLGALFLSLLSIASALEGRTWVVKNAHFELYTKRSGAAKTIRQLEQLRTELSATGLLDTGKERPVHVLIFDDEKEYFLYAPQCSAGFFQSGRDYDFIGSLSTDPHVLGHEYAHAVTSRRWPNAPVWIQEGLAEFYSTVRTSASKVKLGGLQWEYADLIDRLSAQGLPELISTRSVLVRPDRRKTSELYALAWATVNLLGTTDRYQTGFDRFLTALNDKTGLPEALDKVYGVSLNRFIGDLDHHLRSGHFASIEFPLFSGADYRAKRITTPQAGDQVAHNLDTLGFLKSQLGSMLKQ